MYQLTYSNHVCLVGGPLIPMDPNNLDYQTYLSWTAGGNTALPPDATGMPTHTELVGTVLAYARTLRTKLLAVVDGLQSSALTTGNTADAQAIETFKAGLRNITNIDLSLAATEPIMRSLVLRQYKLLAAAAPASVQLAFVQAVA